MENPLTASLIVTGIGIVMLFLAMVLLYGLMYGMTGLIKDRHEEEGKGTLRAGDRKDQVAAKRRAAAVSVALARAELELSAVVASGPRARSSPWRQYHHHRLLRSGLQKGPGR